jgi:hypothetical protein
MSARERIGLQVGAKRIGESGCYFLSILKQAGRVPGAYPEALGYSLALYFDAIDRGWLDEDCLVIDGGALFSRVAGCLWKVKKEGKEYSVQPGELEILRFEVQKTGITYTHFVVGDGKGNVEWDPWPRSLTVKNGQLMGKRIYYQ